MGIERDFVRRIFTLYHSLGEVDKLVLAESDENQIREATAIANQKERGRDGKAGDLLREINKRYPYLYSCAALKGKRKTLNTCNASVVISHIEEEVARLEQPQIKPSVVHFRELHPELHPTAHSITAVYSSTK
jgi:hypothetical protein